MNFLSPRNCTTTNSFPLNSKNLEHQHRNKSSIWWWGPTAQQVASWGWNWGPMCGVNLGTNRGTKGDLVRILGPTADWSPRPAVGPSTPCGGRILRPSQIMTMDYKCLALAWDASSLMLLKLLKPKAVYGIRKHITTYICFATFVFIAFDSKSQQQ